MKKVIFIISLLTLFGHVVSAQWVQVYAPELSTESMYDVVFLNESIGFIAGSGGLIRTNDGGVSWEKFVFFNNCHHISFTDESTGFLATSDSLYKSTDAGNSWEAIFGIPFQSGRLNGFYFTNSETGYIIGQQYNPLGSFINKTSNGGLEWEESFFPGIPTLQSIAFSNSDTGIVVGYSGNIITTYDAGNSWTVTTVPSVETLLSVCFANDSTAFAAGYSNYIGSEIIKTNNAGLSWEQLSTGGSNNQALRSVFFTSVDTGYAVGENGRILKTVNSGQSWVESEPSLNVNYYSVFFLNQDTGYVAGSGTLLKTINQGEGGVITNKEDNRANEQIFSIHPNPASEIVKIHSSSVIQNICIYDLSGKLIYKNERVTSELEINTSHLNPGLYLVCVTNSKDFAAQKLIIR